MQYFSIHSMTALKSNSFSIVRANIDNTPEKVELAKRLYEGDEWYFEYHNVKKDMKWVVNAY